MTINEALLEVQKELKPVKKTSDNPYFKSKYADLEAVAENVTPILNKHGIFYSQFTRVDAGLMVLCTKLVHAKSDSFIQSDIPIIAKDMSDPQKVIAGLTYMRRASLATICGLVTQDDDGNTAADKKPGDEYKKPMPKSPVKVEKGTGNKKYAVFVSCSFDSTANHYTAKTDKGEVYYTTKEVLAQIIRTNFGKVLNIEMTVNSEMQNILLEIL